MTLTDCMQKTRHRQFRLWMDWLDEQWNRPGLTEQYLAQVAQEIENTRLKKPKTSFKAKLLKFVRKDKEAPPPPATPEEAAKAAKARWFAYVGYKPKK